VQHETVVKSYKKCGISKARHGTHDIFFFKKVNVMTIATAVMNVMVNDDFRDYITNMNIIPQ